MMVNFICHMAGAWCLESWSNIILDVSVRMFLGEINIYMDRL